MIDELRVFSLQCRGCGAALQIKPDMNHFACGYCGAQQTVERTGGTISLKLVTDAIARVQAGTDKTAAELALHRLDREVQSLRTAHEQSVRIYRIELMRAQQASAGFLGVFLTVVAVLSFLFGVMGILIGAAVAQSSAPAGLIIAVVLFLGGMGSGIFFLVLNASYAKRAQRRQIQVVEAGMGTRVRRLEEQLQEKFNRIESNRAIVEA